MNLRKEAKGRKCQIRIPGICNHNSQTVVLCHLGGAGMGIKNDDMFGAWGCSACHDAVDKRIKSDLTNHLLQIWFMDGILRTQQILLKEGKIKHD